MCALRDAVFDSQDLLPRALVYLSLQDLCSAVPVCRGFRVATDVVITQWQTVDWWNSVTPEVAEERIREVLTTLQTRNAEGAPNGVPNVPNVDRSLLLEDSGLCAVRVQVASVGLATAWMKTNLCSIDHAVMLCIFRWLLVPDPPSEIDEAFDTHDTFAALLTYRKLSKKKMRNLLYPNVQLAWSYRGFMSNYQNLQVLHRFAARLTTDPNSVVNYPMFLFIRLSAKLLEHLPHALYKSKIFKEEEVRMQKMLLQIISLLPRPPNAPALLIKWATQIEAAPPADRRELYKLVGRILSSSENPS